METRTCTKCHDELPLETGFHKDPVCRGGRRWRCKKCCVAASTAWENRSPAHLMLCHSRTSASQAGLEHTIRLHDIISPPTCKYLGIEIDYTPPPERTVKKPWNGPSIDRIDSTKGYTPPNVQVISQLANRMKSNATLDQLVDFAIGVLAEHRDRITGRHLVLLEAILKEGRS